MIIKNSNLRRMIVENRYLIIVIIIGIILFFSIINVVNSFIKENTKEKLAQTENTTNANNITNANSSYNKPIIGSSQNKNNSTADNSLNYEKTIRDFIKYCNLHQIQNAYNLLSDECKEVVFFSNVEYFRKNYVESIFTTNKELNMQKWLERNATTYRVRLSDDILSTGSVKNETNTIEDYYTIIETEEGKLKLNINGYITRRYIEKSGQAEGINISILKKDIFKEYEQYEIKIENKTSNTIMLDSKENVDSIYLIGSNNSKYSGFTYELDEIKTIIPANTSKNITIRFNKIYSNETVIRKMVFEDIILNYNNYQASLDKKEYKDRLTVSIEM